MREMAKAAHENSASLLRWRFVSWPSQRSEPIQPERLLRWLVGDDLAERRRIDLPPQLFDDLIEAGSDDERRELPRDQRHGIGPEDGLQLRPADG
jgi:hypothetical protein